MNIYIKKLLKKDLLCKSMIFATSVTVGSSIVPISQILIGTANAKTPKPEVVNTTGYQKITWEALLPNTDLQALRNGSDSFLIPEGDEFDTITSPLSMKIKKPRDAYQKALVSTAVRSDMDGKKVKIPGFVVPVDVQGEGLIKTFFFVPYFGQCLHLPPPPPNQIIYASTAKGYKADDINQPYYIEVTLHTDKSENKLVTSAYSATVDKIYPYDYE